MSRREQRGMRRSISVGLASVLAAAALVPVAAAIEHAAPARAASGSVLILSTSVNGGTSSAEARAVPTGYTVTVATPSAWDAMSAAQFAAYSAIIIGDPSSGSCASTVPADALSTASTWGAAVTGNVAVVGTAPALAGSAGSSLMTDAIAYAVAGAGTGLYVSLNCDYSAAAAGTAVPLLAHVDGGGFTVTGQGSTCSNSGTVNTWERMNVPQFNGLPSDALTSWGSPACSVEETLNAWPAQFSGLAYDKGVSPADFTASDGATGQAYVLLGPPVSAAGNAMAPAIGGVVPAGATTGGSNPSAPGVSESTPSVHDVNPENGDFARSDTDLSIPTFGPSLDFSRSYDAQLAQQQTAAGTPGPMGYGWTDDWATSLSPARPVPGAIYTLDGRATVTGQGGLPTSAPLNNPPGVWVDGADVYIADAADNRIEEIPGTSKTQWGKTMTAGRIYTVAGSDTGVQGASGNGTPAASALLNQPYAVTIDSAKNMYIADTDNARALEVPAASGVQRGQTMTANDIYVIAGRTGQPALGNDNKPATQSDLDQPTSLHMGAGSSEDLYIADQANNRIQEIAAANETEWGQSMTANYVYTVAGSAAGTPGSSGDGGAATAALLSLPQGMTISSAGDLYIADTANARIQEVPVSTGTQWTQSMTKYDMYTVAGRTGQPALGNDNKPATQSDLDVPTSVRCNNGQNLYIADSLNNRVQEVARNSHTEWGQAMTADYVYTIAGSAAGMGGHAGDGGPATSALLNGPGDTMLDGSLNLIIADTSNNEIREVSASTAGISDFAGGVGTFKQGGNGGPATSAGLSSPGGVASDPLGDIFIADSGGNRVQEIAAADHTQFGIRMTAGDVYTVAGQQGGYPGVGGDGGNATSAYLNDPGGVAVDPSGNLYIADSGNSRIQEVSAATANISTVAGSATGTSGDSGNGGPATAALLSFPSAVAVDAGGNLYIAGSSTNQVQEVPAVTGHGMTADNIYTIAGDTSGTWGSSGDGGPATSALLYDPVGVAVDAAGNVYIADRSNDRIQEIAASSHVQWGRAMTAGAIYTVVGSATGASGNTGDGGPATAALLHWPEGIAVDASGNLYVADTSNNRIREIAAANGVQWSTAMTAGDIYNVAGSGTGTSGSSGDGGPATSALLSGPLGIGTDSSGDLFLTDWGEDRLREVTATSSPTFPEYPLAGGITVTQPNGSQVTFYPQSGGKCAAPYVVSGAYCTLPQNTATLTYNSGAGTYTFTPMPGVTYTYAWNGTSGIQASAANAAGDVLSVGYGTPAPGAANCPSTAASCETVASASGRLLVIGLNSTGQVTSVTDPLSREWDYAYNSADDLVSATDPMHNVTSYTYGAGNTGNPQLAHDLLTITRPNAQPGGPDAGDATVNVYDASGRVTSQTDPMGFRTTFDYSGLNPSTGNGVVRVNDPDGNTTVYDYIQGAENARSAWTGTTLVAEQDYGPDLATAGTLQDAWTANGDGQIISYKYDSAGNTTTTTDPLGNQTTQWSTPLNQVSCNTTAEAASPCSSSQPGPTPVSPGGAITPPSSAPPQGVTYMQYDTHGNELYTTTGVYQPGSSTASYLRTTYTLYTGNRVTLNGTTVTCTATPPSASLPCAKINADGVVTQLAYNSAGDLTSSSTPDGNGSELATTTYGYDGDGEQTNATSPDGNLAGANAANYTTVTIYNPDGEQTSLTKAGGSGATVTPRTTNYGYDGDGNQTRVQDARGYPTTNTYNANDQQTFVTDPDGNATLTCYDGDGHTTQTVLPVGVAASSLSPSSCPTSYPGGYGNRLAQDATTETYDADGNQTVTTTPAPAGQTEYETTTKTYDAAGNLIQTTAPPTSSSNGAPSQVTRNTYDAVGQLITQITGYGTSAASTTSYCHDANGDTTAVVAPDGNVSGTASCETSSPWVVNANTYPTQAAFQTTSSYDSVGEKVSTTRPATNFAPGGATTSISYDPVGNMLTSVDPNGVTNTRTYTPGNLLATVSYSGSSAHSVTYTYDANGERTAMTDATGSSSYVFNSFGELTSAQNGAGQTVLYSYDADGNTTTITYPLPASATWAANNAATYSYDNADKLATVTDFNGNQITITNTADELPTSIALAATGDSIITTYDSTDTPSAINLKNGSSILLGFSYSGAPSGALLSETDTPSSAQSPVSYGYDPQSRMTSMIAGTGSPVSYSYDASGALTNLPNGAIGTYDKAGELTSSALSGATTSYTYNAGGQRLNAKQGSTTLTSGSWNGANELTAYSDNAANMSAADYNGDGFRATATTTPTGGSPSTQGFVWDKPTNQLLMDSANAYIFGTGETPIEQVSLSNGVITYLFNDELGSVRGVVTSSGTLAASTTYDAWGNPLTSSGLTAYTPFGFAGGYTDPTGLIYLINRYYDPATGQFISVDPELSQTQQPYEYAGDNPVNATDPNGETMFWVRYWYSTRKGYYELARYCDSGHRPAWCSFSFWFHFRNPYRYAWVPEGWRWYLSISGTGVVNGQRYSHGEWGSYNFHGSWYNQGGPTHGRGQYWCGWFGWSICHLHPYTQIEWEAKGKLWLLAQTYYFDFYGRWPA